MGGKIKIVRSQVWRHHRAGGWPSCMAALRTLHDPRGVLFLDFYDDYLTQNIPVREPWVGVLHLAPETRNQDADLARLLSKPVWANNLRYCRGLFTLAETTSEWLRRFTYSLPVETLPYTTMPPAHKFTWERFIQNADKRLMMVGHWLRNFEAFFQVKSPYKKLLLCVPTEYKYQKLTIPRDIQLVNRLSDQEYNLLLSKNVVFLNFYTVGASTTVVECLMADTPLLVNRLPALEQYLGPDYPLFYETVAEAQDLLLDEQKISKGHVYLRQKRKVTPSDFVAAVSASRIYHDL